MKLNTLRSISLSAIAVTTVALAPTSAHALDASTKTTPTSNDSERLSTIIAKGDQEISRRLATLNTLTAKVSAATRLSASDKTYLTNEVNTEVSGLTSLKTKLDAETTLADARTDAQAIFDGYRVYALIVPKIGLVRTADSEQVTDTKLTALATKLQARLTAAQANHKTVDDLQAKLTDMTNQVASAQTTAASIETKVLSLQPTDYNSDHALLSGDRDQLATAHTANQAAIADAKAIVQGLKNL